MVESCNSGVRSKGVEFRVKHISQKSEVKLFIMVFWPN
jgi:hypothetical protein